MRLRLTKREAVRRRLGARDSIGIDRIERAKCSSSSAWSSRTRAGSSPNILNSADVVSYKFKLENIEQEAENSLSTIASWRTFQVERVEVTEERRRKNQRQRKKGIRATQCAQQYGRLVLMVAALPFSE